MSESLFEKFNDLSVASSQADGADRIIRRITITKDRVMSGAPRMRQQLIVRRLHRTNGYGEIRAARSQESVLLSGPMSIEDHLEEVNEEGSAWTLGISIVQGTDNNVYVKELVCGGPGSAAGICVGDQVSQYFLYLPISCKLTNLSK